MPTHSNSFLPIQSPIRGGSTPNTSPSGSGITPPGYGDFTVVCNPVYVREQHITVIRRGPTMPPSLEMHSWDPEDKQDIGNLGGIVLEDDFYSAALEYRWDINTSSPIPNIPDDGGDAISAFYTPQKELKKLGDEIYLNILLNQPDSLDLDVGYKVIIKYNFTNSLGVIQTASVRGEVLEAPIPPNPNHARIKLTSIPFNFPLILNTNQIYTLSVIKKDPIFEYKFPKFAYRYRYEDGEYSVFSPWSEIAFIPGKFDYLPKKGYNLGMVNNLRSLKILNWRPKNIPKDVVEIDLLYKESNSPNIYTVETFEISESDTDPWNIKGTGEHFGDYTITSELIHKVVPSNQLLRPWDNVPRMALGQEITANRLIYANYLQNYNLLEDNADPASLKKYLKPIFSISINSEVDHSIDGPYYEANVLNLSQGTSATAGLSVTNQPKYPMKSLKSMRTYQLGVVYRDRYGRETPVLTSKSGSIKVPKSSAKLQNKFEVGINTKAPDWAESYTFYIKETSNEYYNLSMDRWYDAEDGGIWLSFPSSEVNKVKENSVLILKKQHGNDKPVESDIKYKVIDVKNNAPEFIKEEIQYWGVLPMMLPPPGWGVLGRVGGWDSGMFYPTGLPLPERLYLDIYAEYFDQSVLSGLTSKENAEVRIVQSQSTPSSYNAWSSDSINKSNWYGVANVNYIGSPSETHTETVTINGIEVEQQVETSGQAEQLVRITLEKLMGQDMAFCEPKDDLSLDRGLSLEARTRTKRNKAQFEGRFFVKIHRDADAETNIIRPQSKFGEQYQVLMAKEIKYICFAHPGVQDWRTDEAGTVGANQSTKSRWYQGGDKHSNYLSNISLNYLPPAFDPDTSNNSGLYHQKYYDPANFYHRKREVSSFSATVGNIPFTGAFPLITNSGGSNISPNLPGTTTHPYNWPIGPGWHASDVYSSNSIFPNYANTYSAYAYGNGGSLPYWPVSAKHHNGWPAFAPDHWAPNTTTDTDWVDDVGIAPIPPWATYSGQGNGPHIQKHAKWNAGLLIVNHGGNTPDAMKQVPPANPYQVPAIWGSQGDFFNNHGNPAGSNYIYSTGLDAGITHNENYSEWDKGTLQELRTNWRMLWEGRNLVSNTWPPGHSSPERWFFDKVGAAKGYSGNGIWDEGDVSKMHISFYGIGDKNYRHRSHDMVAHQANEIAFAEAIGTVGTQFRFRSDPDQVIYTVTGIAEPELIYNYETVRGTWGWEESYDPTVGITSLVVDGGSGIGEGKVPPYGPWIKSHSGSVAGKQAFISDVFKNQSQDFETLTGGAPYNYRIRWTLTLDKIVGNVTNGDAGFHPLKKHVDSDGNCNIEMGPKVYWSGNGGVAPSHWKGGHTPKEKDGGTIEPVAFYNLSSYWNNTTGTAPTSSQSRIGDLNGGDGDTNGQHFGLHEAGLNGTWLEIVTPYREDNADDTMNTNPAVWETEPMEDVGLDIYYAASPTYPIKLKRWRSDRLTPDPIDYHWNPAGNIETEAYHHDYGWRGEEVIPVGAQIKLNPPNSGHASQVGAIVVAVQGDTIWVDNILKYSDPALTIPMSVGNSDILKIHWKGEGAFYGGQKDARFVEVSVHHSVDIYTIKLRDLHSSKHLLSYFNCYTFANGVESNRIRDDYNAVTIDKGVKASMPLAEKYTEERRGSSLIFSGIYNSTSGINRLNQFIQAEPITKDLNPINGTIQKLFARDTDLITFCENKVFKILANKDALFNAGGDTNLTATNRVLGQTIPFVGDYGISKNPESLANESYRLYFTDKTRGVILRLSRDGLTPISNYGMKDWFKDNLKGARKSIIGSFDDAKGHYNITLETIDKEDGLVKAYTLSYSEAKKGWESFKSFLHQGGISYENIYYTVPYNNIQNELVGLKDPWGIEYGIPDDSAAQLFEHNLDLTNKRFVQADVVDDKVLQFNNSNYGEIFIGMNVEGNGVPYGTFVERLLSTDTIKLNNKVFVSASDELTFTMPRNKFYFSNEAFFTDYPLHYSMLKVLFNGAPGSVKRYKTLNYEGDQALVTGDANNLYGLHDDMGTNVSFEKYIDNWYKPGWYVKNLFTDMQKGTLKEFLDKENKWYNYIRGYQDANAGDELDSGEFSAQGLGVGNLRVQ